MWIGVTPLLPTLIAVVLIHQICSASSAQVDSPCRSDTDCKKETTFLICSKGVCTCGDVSTFDRYQGICLVFPGGACDATSGRGSGKKCIQNAVCQSKSRGATIGVCECNKGYEEVYDGTCNSSESARGTTLLVLITSVLAGSYFTTRWSMGL